MVKNSFDIKLLLEAVKHESRRFWARRRATRRAFTATQPTLLMGASDALLTHRNALVYSLSQVRRLPCIESTSRAHPRFLPAEIRGSDSMNQQNSHAPAPRKDPAENSC
jgi:hypothetical protein